MAIMGLTAVETKDGGDHWWEPFPGPLDTPSPWVPTASRLLRGLTHKWQSLVSDCDGRAPAGRALGLAGEPRATAHWPL